MNDARFPEPHEEKGFRQILSSKRSESFVIPSRQVGNWSGIRSGLFSREIINGET